MCGIAGAVFWERSGELDPIGVVRAMTDALAHRGPDGHGVECAPTLGPAPANGPLAVLGHRRLAIIDLTERAAQPMRSAREPVAITFNGEIYNFKAVRRELESAGRHFRSDSDTEVILQGYEHWGERVVDRLRGMFAFAIWDGRTNALLMTRDRLGIKPLYVHRAPGRLLFASEIRALLASGLVDRRLDLTSLDEYLAYQTVPPPRTLIRDVEMIAPGHSVVAGPDGGWNDRAYWDLLDSADRDAARSTDRVEVRGRLGALLAESTALHLVSDVPVAIFLSGGIDSSALVGLVRDAGMTPRTFTVTCPGTPFDEAVHARTVATAFGANHTEIALTETDLLSQLPDALAGVDHPSGDGINTFVVSRAVRGAGIKVALSGLGGDEFFGGYPSFLRMERLAALGFALRCSPTVVRRAAATVVRTFGREAIASSKAAAFLETDGTFPSTFPLMRQMFSAEQRRELLAPAQAFAESHDPYVAILQAAAARRHPSSETMQFVSYAEARTYMHDVLLRDTDQMAMRHGLEVRVPLLDHRLVQYLMGLPDAMKRSNGQPKQLLVETLKSRVPAAAVSRPKQGFELPFDPWMRASLRTFCQHHLGPDGLLKLEVFRPAGVRSVWQSFLNRDGRVTWSRPWTLVALNAWLEHNGVSA